MKLFKLTAFITFILSLFFSACKKDEKVDDNDLLPVFGTCKPVPTTGNMSQSVADNTFTYLTSGGGKIFIDHGTIAISHKDYENFKIELWGLSNVGDGSSTNYGTHENLNGKHIKDRTGSRRTIIFPDGAKLTMVALGIVAPLVSISIRDGNAYSYINYRCMTLEYCSSNSKYAQRLDDAEADGETRTFIKTATGVLFNNIYTEDTPGNKIEKLVPLGELFKDEPKKVYDYYDDPRLNNT